jgi:hypothetical protein
MSKKRVIKVKMVGYGEDWGGIGRCAPHKDKIIELLQRHYELEYSESPDYLFFGGMGHEHYKYECIKIAQIGENFVPDFNSFDYAIGMSNLDFGDRYLRVPHFAYFDEYKKLAELPQWEDASLLNRGFCSFVVSNMNRSDPIRLEFFKQLSKYKMVSSGGKVLNNVGGIVQDKLEFCKNYKFNIAFENSSSDGYTTEKIMQPLTVGSVPIYFGNPLIEKDFNPDCMVRVADYEDIPRAIEEVRYLDQCPKAYLEKCRARAIDPCEINRYDDNLERFLAHIVEQPYDKAIRINKYGYQRDLWSQYRHMARVNEMLYRMKIYRIVDMCRGVRRWFK